LISDDGRGIDPDKIRAKAIEKGLLEIRNASGLNRKQLLQYVFVPGFSTATQVSDVSGRGVGMDVVRTNVNNLNGSVEINSTFGQGTQIQLKLPSHTSVVVEPCILAGVGAQRFLIPLKNVRELIRPDRIAISSVQNKGEVMNIRNRLYSMLRLHEIFDIKPQSHEISETIIALIEANNQYAALMLDEVYGQQKAVIKKMQGELADLDGISGTAVLGDGRIGIVLDVAKLLNHTMAQ
jgi:two-component system chemotaxis sensor kinase CheA